MNSQTALLLLAAVMVGGGFAIALLARRLKQLEAAAGLKARELEELHEIGIALSAERDHDRLLNIILSKSREITSADAGSLFIVDSIDMKMNMPGDDATLHAVSGRWLRFRLAQNDSREFRFEEDILKISPESIAGYVAETGETLNLADAYDPPKDKPFVINRSFDEATGYRTRSILVVPMQNRDGDVIGVLQLINKKRNRSIVLDTVESFTEHVLPFDAQDERLVRSLASQAAVCVENNNLNLQIENLFGSFVDAAVQAIESRDKTTQGHSRRVAVMTTELAKVTDRCDSGPYASLTLSRDQLRELNYAALLHDFGKVGVRENVLIKATKLYHGELSLVRQRFKTIRRTLETEHLRKMVDRLLENGATAEDIEKMRLELQRELAFVEEASRCVEAANKPTVSHFSEFDRLTELGERTYRDIDGRVRSYLESDELLALSVSRGSLTEPERRQIQSHVNHTFDFLRTIPWTRDLQAIPDLAKSHHEKLDGTGYPDNLSAEHIPPQTRMMTIADIYDALTARDRPYKPAVKTEKALDILSAEAKAGKIDRDLLQLFIEAAVFKKGLTN